MSTRTIEAIDTLSGVSRLVDLIEAASRNGGGAELDAINFASFLILEKLQSARAALEGEVR